MEIDTKKDFLKLNFYITSFFFTTIYIFEAFNFKTYGIFSSQNLDRFIRKNFLNEFTYINNLISFFFIFLFLYLIQKKLDLKVKENLKKIDILFITLFLIFITINILPKMSFLPNIPLLYDLYNFIYSIVRNTVISKLLLIILSLFICLIAFLSLNLSLDKVREFFRFFIISIGFIFLLESIISVINLYPKSIYIINDNNSYKEKIISPNKDEHKIIAVVFDEWDYDETSDIFNTYLSNYDKDNYYSGSFTSMSTNTFCSTMQILMPVVPGDNTFCVLNTDSNGHLNKNLEIFDQPNYYKNILNNFYNTNIYHDFYFPYCSLISSNPNKCYENSMKITKKSIYFFTDNLFHDFKNIFKSYYVSTAGKFFHKDLLYKYPFPEFTLNSRKILLDSFYEDISKKDNGLFYSHLLMPHMPYFYDGLNFSNYKGTYEGNSIYITDVISNIVKLTNFENENNVTLIFTSDHHNRYSKIIKKDDKNVVPVIIFSKELDEDFTINSHSSINSYINQFSKTYQSSKNSDAIIKN